MHLSKFLLILTSLSGRLLASPVPRSSDTNPLSNPNYGPVPGESLIFNEYNGKAAPFPANSPRPVLARPKALEPRMQGVEASNESSFTESGFPNTTYQRIVEIRDNKAGHLRIFQDSISSNSIKPGACKYNYGFSNPEVCLGLQNLLEVSSMSFLTGLVQQAQTNTTKGALIAIGEVEAQHETWALIDIWKTNPFSSPSDTIYPYANQILDLLQASFILPGSCPSKNPPYPSPSQNLPKPGSNPDTTTGLPGFPITFTYVDHNMVPKYEHGKDYYAVFFYSVHNITMPFDTTTNWSPSRPSLMQVEVSSLLQLATRLGHRRSTAWSLARWFYLSSLRA